MVFKKLKKRYRIMIIVLMFFVAIAIAIAIYMNHPKFGRAPQGERLERIRKSPNYHDGSFKNQSLTPQLTSDKSRLKVMFDFLFEKRERNRPKYPLPNIKTDLKALDINAELLVWFGHSSYFIQSNRKRILIDPVFEEASPVPFTNQPFEGTDIYTASDIPDVDYLIITHDHWDHLDYKTVMKLRERISHVICPLGVGEYFEQWGFDSNKITELDWNEEMSFEDGYTIYCLPARHFSGRTFKANQTLWASFMIKTPNQYIYVSGDGGYDKHFSEIAQKFPQIDLAIMENGQYNEDWRYIHLMPDDLREAVLELKPAKVFAGHNSKYALAKHAWDEPLNNAAQIAEQYRVDFIMSVIGEVVYLTDEEVVSKKWWIR